MQLALNVLIKMIHEKCIKDFYLNKHDYRENWAKYKETIVYNPHDVGFFKTGLKNYLDFIVSCNCLHCTKIDN